MMPWRWGNGHRHKRSLTTNPRLEGTCQTSPVVIEKTKANNGQDGQARTADAENLHRANFQESTEEIKIVDLEQTLVQNRTSIGEGCAVHFAGLHGMCFCTQRLAARSGCILGIIGSGRRVAHDTGPARPAWNSALVEARENYDVSEVIN